MFQSCCKMSTGIVKLFQNKYDTYTDKNTEKEITVESFTWENSHRMSVQLITYGATITSIKLPDKIEIIKDVVTGFSNISGYQKPENPYFGATVGRCANRIASAQFKLFGRLVQLSKNHGNNQLHGGFVGFDKVKWEHYVDGNRVILSYHSKNLEEGFPGDLVVFAIFELTENNEFYVEYRATCTKPTYVNMTNHSYFNLAGHNSGPNEIRKHLVCINANQITEVNKESIPTGKLLDVSDTVFDLRVPKILGELIDNVPESPGFDHNFCVNKASEQDMCFVAKVVHPPSGRVLEVYSNQPGVQFYTANFFPEDESLNGKDGNYFKHGAFCLETQNFPDAPNHQNFPKWMLLPGETYRHCVLYKFFVQS